MIIRSIKVWNIVVLLIIVINLLVMKENTYNTYLIHIKPLELLTKDEYEKIYLVIFARRNPQEHPTIRSCLYHLAVGTQVKIKQNEEGEDDEILISWRIEKKIHL